MNKDSMKQLQMLEQTLHSVHMQKQQFQSQLIELESAASELDKTKSAYKIIGNIMVASSPSDLKKDIEQKKEMFSTRLKVLEKQEQQFREQAEKIQKELVDSNKK